jgi:hypothetical protein
MRRTLIIDADSTSAALTIVGGHDITWVFGLETLLACFAAPGNVDVLSGRLAHSTGSILVVVLVSVSSILVLDTVQEVTIVILVLESRRILRSRVHADEIQAATIVVIAGRRHHAVIQLFDPLGA